MSKPERNFIVRGFNYSAEHFSTPTGKMADKTTFKEAVVDTQAEAITLMLSDPILKSMSVPEVMANAAELKVEGRHNGRVLDPNSIVVVNDLKIVLNSADKLTVRNVKSVLREVIKSWAEKSRVKGRRGFRTSAIRTPVFEYNDITAFAKVQVILSNAIAYSDYKVDVTPQTSDEISTDLESLKKELKKRLGWMFVDLYVNNSIIGKGKV